MVVGEVVAIAMWSSGKVVTGLGRPAAAALTTSNTRDIGGYCWCCNSSGEAECMRGVGAPTLGVS